MEGSLVSVQECIINREVCKWDKKNEYMNVHVTGQGGGGLGKVSGNGRNVIKRGNESA